MVESHGLVGGIPAIFWGADRPKRLIAVHGFGGSKGDRTIRLLARRAVPLGWQVVSCDLPGHGSRDYPLCPYEPKRCVEDCGSSLPGSTGARPLSSPREPEPSGHCWPTRAALCPRPCCSPPPWGPGFPCRAGPPPPPFWPRRARAALPLAGRRILPRNITAPSPRPPGPTVWNPGWTGYWPNLRNRTVRRDNVCRGALVFSHCRLSRLKRAMASRCKLCYNIPSIFCAPGQALRPLEHNNRWR